MSWEADGSGGEGGGGEAKEPYKHFVSTLCNLGDAAADNHTSYTGSPLALFQPVNIFADKASQM
jgi:hypothetical protein